MFLYISQSGYEVAYIEDMLIMEGLVDRSKFVLSLQVISNILVRFISINLSHIFGFCFFMSVILVFKKSETTPAQFIRTSTFLYFLIIFFKTKSLSFLSSKSHT